MNRPQNGSVRNSKDNNGVRIPETWRTQNRENATFHQAWIQRQILLIESNRHEFYRVVTGIPATGHDALVRELSDQSVIGDLTYCDVTQKLRREFHETLGDENSLWESVPEEYCRIANARRDREWLDGNQSLISAGLDAQYRQVVGIRAIFHKLLLSALEHEMEVGQRTLEEIIQQINRQERQHPNLDASELT